jgi:transcriptional regulator with XRE-family HTH domain
MEERMMRITSAAGFGEVIRARRKELHYTQGFLSEFSGLSVSFISDLENGKKTAELEKAIYLANLLGLDLCLEGREHGA